MKISIITPVYNQVDYIEQTILSVINQDYDNYEYIIIDGGSTDGTLDIIKSYASKITTWISETDTGMYDALNKGFALSTGDIMAWINSDDLLLPNALQNMNRIMSDLPNVNWVQGLNGFIDLEGKIIKTGYPKPFSFIKFLNKDYKFIQQESTFWRRSLWENAGAYMNTDLKLAGDFELWFRFFQYDKLYTSSLPIGSWRRRAGQLSDVQMDKYVAEVYKVIDSYTLTQMHKRILEKLRHQKVLFKIIRKIKILNSNYFSNKIQTLEDIKKTRIEFNEKVKKFVVE
jgi:glycosyltransferase involved in cell wall biosynthesis